MISADRLKKLPLFRDTRSDALDLLGREMTERPFATGETICREGEKSGSVFLIGEGRVAVSKRLAEGAAESKVVARLGGGEFFGEMSFLQDQAHSATVTAETPGLAFVLPRSALDGLAGRDPKAALESLMTIFSGLSRRLRATTRELVSLYEIARVVAQAPNGDALAAQVTDQLGLELGPQASIGFYRWNPFNEEFALLGAGGFRKDAFPPALELKDVEGFRLDAGERVVAPMTMGGNREGLLLFFSAKPDGFDPGEKQLMETVAAVLAPALATARAKDEETARARLQQRKQERYGV